MSRSLKAYQGADLRNVALVGHAHCGKTTLVSALLQAARMTERLGRVDDGSAVTAYDEEDVARRTTMQNALAFAEWHDVKINFLDTPGFPMFAHEAHAALLPVEAALVVVNAACGVEAMTRRVWKFAEEFNLPRLIVVNQMDHPHADLERTLNALRESFGRHVVPVQLPIMEGGAQNPVFRGVVDLITMEAFVYEPDGSGRGRLSEVPVRMRKEAIAAHQDLVELVAEGRDAWMEEFFREGTLPKAHLIVALHEAIREDKIFPVLFTSGLRNVGSDHLLDFLQLYAPSPVERVPIAARGTADAVAEMVLRKVEDAQPLSLYVFKTLSDPIGGRISFFKVFSGVARRDSAVTNYTHRSAGQLAHLTVMQGRTAMAVAELHAGDLGAVARLGDTYTGDTLGAAGHEIFFEAVPMPEPAVTYSIEPRTQADEDKLEPAVHKLMEEDLMVRFHRDAFTHEFLLTGSGQPHIESVVHRLHRRYHTDVTLKAPRIPYRETVRASADGQGKYLKQGGNQNQLADCWIRVEPLTPGGGFAFVNEIYDRPIPRGVLPAIELGVQEAAACGWLAGFPVVDFRAILFDGSFHDADERSFRLAGKQAFRHCMEQCRPILLEPLMRVEIEAPETYAGALIADLTVRRGRVQQLGNGSKTTVIRAEVPMADMLSYGTTLTSLTQGTGSYYMELARYDAMPDLAAEKLIASAQRHVQAHLRDSLVADSEL